MYRYRLPALDELGGDCNAESSYSNKLHGNDTLCKLSASWVYSNNRYALVAYREPPKILGQHFLDFPDKLTTSFQSDFINTRYRQFKSLKEGVRSSTCDCQRQKYRGNYNPAHRLNIGPPCVENVNLNVI